MWQMSTKKEQNKEGGVCVCVRGVCTLYYPRYRAQINVGVIHWDVTRLPLKTHSVDVVVTDLVRHCLILCG